jgi:hypothetical protein
LNDPGITTLYFIVNLADVRINIFAIGISPSSRVVSRTTTITLGIEYNIISHTLRIGRIIFGCFALRVRETR